MSKEVRIEGILVTSANIGDPVTYCPPHAKMNAGHKDAEKGRISSIDEDRIFVRFNAPNGALCRQDLLVWG